MLGTRPRDRGSRRAPLSSAILGKEYAVGHGGSGGNVRKKTTKSLDIVFLLSSEIAVTRRGGLGRPGLVTTVTKNQSKDSLNLCKKSKRVGEKIFLKK